jgi:hypothetical protein
VTYEGEVRIEAIKGANGVYYKAFAWGSTTNPSNIIGQATSQYATVGDNQGQPTIGFVSIHPATPPTGITVIEP